MVDAGHHQRRLLRLTGLDAQENQARRLLNDMDAYRASDGTRTRTRRSAPTMGQLHLRAIVRSIPRELGGKLEPAEVVHEVLEHRWYMSQKEDRNVPLAEAVQSYIDTILRYRRDEDAIMLSTDTATIKMLESGVLPDTAFED